MPGALFLPIYDPIFLHLGNAIGIDPIARRRQSDIRKAAPRDAAAEPQPAGRAGQSSGSRAVSEALRRTGAKPAEKPAPGD